MVAGAGRYHQFEVNLRRRVLGLDPQHVRPLDTNQAMEVATGVMGEVILFAMAGGAVYWEWARCVATHEPRCVPWQRPQRPAASTDVGPQRPSGWLAWVQPTG